MFKIPLFWGNFGPFFSCKTIWMYAIKTYFKQEIKKFVQINLKSHKLKQSPTFLFLNEWMHTEAMKSLFKPLFQSIKPFKSVKFYQELHRSVAKSKWWGRMLFNGKCASEENPVKILFEQFWFKDKITLCWYEIRRGPPSLVASVCTFFICSIAPQ